MPGAPRAPCGPTAPASAPPGPAACGARDSHLERTLAEPGTKHARPSAPRPRLCDPWGSLEVLISRRVSKSAGESGSARSGRAAGVALAPLC